MTVLVAGAAGLSGSAVVDELVARGVEVRATSRSAARTAGMRRPGVEAVTAAFDDDTALMRALDGVSAAYLATPASPQMADAEGAFARAAARSGAHLVKLSTLGARADAPMRFGRAHAEAEAAVEASGAGWTFVQANGFMQNDLAWAAQVGTGTVAGPVMDAAWSVVDARDVAAVAAVVLTDPGRFAARRVAVTGPEPLTPRQRVTSLGRLLGRPLTAVDLPLDVVADQLDGYGLPAWQVGGLLELFELYASGAATGVDPAIESVLGRPATSWARFANDHRAHFDVG